VDTETQTKMVVRSLRGAPWTVVMAMVMLPNLHGEMELAGATGYSRKTVRQALIDLESLGFVQRNGRFEVWILTSRARQMVLGEAEQEPEPEAIEVEAEAVDAGAKGKKYPSPSSSSYMSLPASTDSQTTTTTTQSDGKFLPLDDAQAGEDADGDASQEKDGRLDDAALDAVARMVDLGAPQRTRNGKGARDAVEAALRGGWTSEQTLDAVDGWCAYAGSARGESLSHPGFFVTKQIRSRVPAPAEATRPESPEERQRRYIEEAYARTVAR